MNPSLQDDCRPVADFIESYNEVSNTTACGETEIERTWTYLDNCSNTSVSYTQIITIQGNQGHNANDCGRDMYEPNNTVANASNFYITTFRNSYICPQGDVDWYHFVVSPNRRFATIRLERLAADYALEVYDNMNVLVASSDNDCNENELISLDNMAVGDYWIKVIGNGNWNNETPYDLHLNLRTSNTGVGGTKPLITNPYTFSVLPVISPNPVKDYLSVLNVNANNTMTITDVHGKIHKRFVNTTSQINVEVLPKGIYFLNIETQETITTLKFLVLD